MSKNRQYSGHRERLRQKFLISGIGSLHDYEKLELLLTYSVPIKDVKPVGKNLIKKFKYISSVMDADIDELMDIKGVGAQSIILIKFVRDLLTTYSYENMVGSDYLNSPEKVVDFSKLKIGALKNETFLIIFLTTKNKVIDYKFLSEGTVDSVAVYPRRVIELAFKRYASGIIIVHNHPSGDTEPSQNDIELTKEIEKLSCSLDLRLLDHLIVSKNKYYSFSRNGLLP
ncbi:MAG: RadC family protein [Thermodesulfobacteriota bacterium]